MASLSGEKLEDRSSCPHTPKSTELSNNPTSTPPIEDSSLPSSDPTTKSDGPEADASVSKKRKRLTSDVWKHFEKMIINGEEKAKCMHCNKYMSDGSKNGTSHLHDHIKIRCPKKNAKLDPRQMLLNYNASKSEGKSSLENYNFNPEVSRKDLSNMVAMHEYPLSIVDHIEFRRYVKGLNPTFKLITHNTLKSDIMKTFETSKTTLKTLFEGLSGRIAITTDMWTVCHQKKGYMAITAHFIEHRWVLHNRTLRFAFVPCPHTKQNLAQVLVDCCNMYNIAEKVSSVVVDNCSTNDAMMDELRGKFDSSSLMLGGDFLHMRCSAHIINLVVQDGMDVIGPAIVNIRNCVLFWTATPKRIEKFEDKARALKLDCSRKLILDCKTRWNSTFFMLQSAFPYKDVFAKLKIQNSFFTYVLPTDQEWKLASIVCEKLEVFYKVTLLFSGRKFPTVNLFFKEICEIKLALAEWLSSDQLVVREMAEKMMVKFDKYWSSINGLLVVAAVLDSRDKMGCVEYYFNEIYGDLAEMEIDRVRSLLYDLLAEYQDKDETNQGDYALGESQVCGKLNVVAGSSHKAIGAKLSRWDIATKTM